MGTMSQIKRRTRLTRGIAISGTLLLVGGLSAGCASMNSMERTVRGWTGLDEGLANLDRNDDGVISQDEASENPALSAEFDQVDTNQDRNINPAELRAAYTSVAEFDFSDADFNGDGVISEREAQGVRPSLSEVFDRVDSDDDGNVSKSEYQAARLNLLARSEFAAFDTDGDGIIDEDEADKEQALADDFSSVDADGDDMISEKEFKKAQSR
jgi:Ca2+-binding EF-hand superfamily protein